MLKNNIIDTVLPGVPHVCPTVIESDKFEDCSPLAIVSKAQFMQLIYHRTYPEIRLWLWSPPRHVKWAQRISGQILNASIQRALDEDIHDGDVTSDCTIAADAHYQGYFLAKDSGVVAELSVVQQTFALVDERIAFQPLNQDGDKVENGTILATVAGPGQSLRAQSGLH